FAGDFEAAERQLSRAAAQPGRACEARLYLGLALRELRRNDPARRAFESAAADCPVGVRVLQNRAELEMQRWQLDDAMVLPADAAAQKRNTREEKTDYYKRWLERDVVYIITDEERAVFKKLSTPEERDAFVEQFWLRRDPDPRTAPNEFKEEHYRRIAYANERYASGIE